MSVQIEEMRRLVQEQNNAGETLFKDVSTKLLTLANKGVGSFTKAQLSELSDLLTDCSQRALEYSESADEDE